MRNMWISGAAAPVTADRHSVPPFGRHKTAADNERFDGSFGTAHKPRPSGEYDVASFAILYYNDTVGRRPFGLRPVV